MTNLRRPLGWLLTSLALLLGAHGWASSIDVYEFETREQEARFHQLNSELRCPKCQNTNLWGSDSPIAQDLRRTVANMVLDGYSNAEIKDYMASRYGDYILYRPRFTARTAALWVGPFVLLFLGIGILGGLVYNQRRQQQARARAGGETALSAEEHARLQALRERLRSEAGTDPAR